MSLSQLSIKYKSHLSDRKFLTSLLMAFLFLILSIIATYFAIQYADEKASGSVTDIVLSNIPVFDVDGIFLYGPIVFWLITIFYAFAFEFKKTPFMLKSLALCVTIRAIFITLTHIGPFPDHTITNVSNSFFSVFTSGNDLFFSGHTGFPYLMALIFWDNKYSRWFFLFSSFFFGAIVLMSHLHYSIDVAAAFFITYAIFRLAQKWFKKEQSFFENIEQ